MEFLLGIDVSTTSVKSLLVDEGGRVVSSGSTEQPLYTPQPLWSEQNPRDWWTGVQQSIRQALAGANIRGEQVAAVGLTGQMHGLVLLDASCQVLRPAILWNDQRTGPQCEEIKRRLGRRLLEITGNQVLTGFTAPKIIWVRENEPEIYRQVAHILLPKDYIRYRLTGEFATDKADGAGMLLFDLKARDFSPEVLAALDIPPVWLPKTYEGPEITGEITPYAAGLTGLNAGTPVVGGGGDQASQAVGVGAVLPETIALTLGTSGVVFASTKAPFMEAQGRLHAFCHAVPNTWHLMGVMLSAGGSLRWYRDTFEPDVGYERLLAPAVQVPPGSEGLLFLPYLTGERTPHPDPLARGAFVGLTVRHSQAHLARAVMEGVAFGLHDIMELMRTTGLGAFQQVRISGGGAKSSLWRQILADVLGRELVTVNTAEGAAYGAALLAGVGAGVWGNVIKACQATIKVLESTQPQPESQALYQQIYHIYRNLYPSLRESFQAIDRLR